MKNIKFRQRINAATVIEMIDKATIKDGGMSLESWHKMSYYMCTLWVANLN